MCVDSDTSAAQYSDDRLATSIIVHIAPAPQRQHHYLVCPSPDMASEVHDRSKHLGLAIPYIRYQLREKVRRICSKSVTVCTAVGALRGAQVACPKYGYRYAHFLGVPYGRPPVGDRRFRVSEPQLRYGDRMSSVVCILSIAVTCLSSKIGKYYVLFSMKTHRK